MLREKYDWWKFEFFRRATSRLTRDCIRNRECERKHTTTWIRSIANKEDIKPITQIRLKIITDPFCKVVKMWNGLAEVHGLIRENLCHYERRQADTPNCITVHGCRDRLQFLFLFLCLSAKFIEVQHRTGMRYHIQLEIGTVHLNGWESSSVSNSSMTKLKHSQN
jgi:hypothetical protein